MNKVEQLHNFLIRDALYFDGKNIDRQHRRPGHLH